MDRSLMHKFLRYTAHIDTSPSQAPFRPRWGLLHIIDDYCLEAMLGGFECRCQTARAAAYYGQIVDLVVFFCG